MDRLLALIDRVLPADPMTKTEFLLPSGDGATMHLLHEHAQVLATQYGEDGCHVTANAPESLRQRLHQFMLQ
jgi:50S ribosomal subunit-associated GTPase HflX